MVKQTAPSSFEREVAETVTPELINPKVRQMEVIDTDFHFMPSWAKIREHMAPPHRDRLYSYPATSTEFNPEAANAKPGMGQDVMGRAGTGPEVLTILDRIGVDTVTLNPGFNRPAAMLNAAAIEATASAYNDYLIKEVFPVSKRITASMMVCQRRPLAAAREIKRVGNHPQFVGVFAEFGQLTKPLASADFDPMWDAMRDLKLGLTYHTGGIVLHFSPTFEGVSTWTELFGNLTAANCIVNAGSMILQGLFDKYPDQKILFQEGGYWWVSDLMTRLDEYYTCHAGDICLLERKMESGERFLNKLPSEYVLSNIRFSTQPMSRPRNRKHWGMMLEINYASDLLCYSSDWPHQTFDPANWVVENPDLIDEEMQKRILSGNAKEVFPRLKG